MSAASAFTVTVNYATSNGTATAGVDYTARSGTLTFGPGATSASFTVPITNDATIEVTETVNLTLSSPTNATLGTPNPATLAILDEDGAPPPTDEFYTYNKLGNLTSKTGKGSYSYPATGSAHPHAVTSTSDGQTYVYDANGNMTSTGGLISTYDAENRPTHLSRVSGTEDAAYDADGERVTRTFGFTTTVYLGGLWEEDVVGGASVGTRSLYTFNGVMVAQRDAMGVVYLHGDHLGSISVTTGAGGAKLSSQEYDPWGKVRPGSSIGQTALNYTGQRLDTTGLLYYHARYYDPNLGRFISADPVVPSSASGSMDGVALKPLTVDFHEPGFVSSLSGENQQSFWFQMSDRERQQAGIPWGPANPQALNRYSYVLNNPLRSTDPTGHLALNREQALALQEILERQGGVLDILEAQRNREKLGIGLIVALFSGGISGGFGAALGATTAGAELLGVGVGGIAGVTSFLAGIPDILHIDPNGTQQALAFFKELDTQLRLFIESTPATTGASSPTIDISVQAHRASCVSYPCNIAPHNIYTARIVWGGREHSNIEVPWEIYKYWKALDRSYGPPSHP